MSAFVLRAQQYPVSRWKNGLGVTRTVAIAPAGSDLTSFEWRISMADIGVRTPFSPLPEIDRWLMPAAGGAIAVSVDGNEQVLQIGDVLAFSGDATTTGGLLDANTTQQEPGSRDLNLMVRRPHHGASLESFVLSSAADLSQVLSLHAEGALTVMVLLSNELDIGITKLRQFDSVFMGADVNGLRDRTAPEIIELPDDWPAVLLRTANTTPEPVHDDNAESINGTSTESVEDEASSAVRIAVATITAKAQ